jgi:hypothetical protein
VAPGGSAGQVLAKSSSTDYDTEWIDPPSGGGDWTLLWTNASPTSDFAAQTVALDLSAYADVKIDCLRVNTSPDIFSFFVKPGETAYMYTIGNLDFANAYVLTTMRRANVGSNGVVFEDALRKYTNVQTKGQVINALLIPERIYAR